MNNNYILSLSNDELFRLVKEKFGIEVKDENDMAVAWQVVEKLKGRFGITSVKRIKEGKWLCRTGDHMNVITVMADPPPIAIYRAALLALVEGDTDD